MRRRAENHKTWVKKGLRRALDSCEAIREDGWLEAAVLSYGNRDPPPRCRKPEPRHPHLGDRAAPPPHEPSNCAGIWLSDAAWRSGV